MKFIFIFSIFFSTYLTWATLSPQENKPYKILIVTDPEAGPRAKEFQEYLLTKPPYSRMGREIEIELVTMDPKVMNCTNSDARSPRIVTCNKTAIFKLQSEHNAHLSVAFTSKANGGSGGNIPIASKNYPIQTMLHEMLHTYGLHDEYDYSNSEKKVYCQLVSSAPNLVYFKDKPPYADDSEARTRHSRQVPWMGEIPTEQPITKGKNFGSPGLFFVSTGSQQLGIFRGGSCNSDTLPGWRPYYSSIMKGYSDDTIYPIYENAIIKKIEGTLGRKINFPSSEPDCSKDQKELGTINNLQDESAKILNKVHKPQ